MATDPENNMATRVPATAPKLPTAGNNLILSGAPFGPSVNAAIPSLRAGCLLVVQISIKATDSPAELVAALKHLRPFIAPHAVVTISVSPANAIIASSTLLQYSTACGVPVTQIVSPTPSVSPVSPPSNLAGFGAPQINPANQAALFQMQATDMQQAQTIYTQMAGDAQKQQMERWQIMQATQSKIFEITQDVTVNKAKTADKAFAAMDGYIRG